MELASGVGLKMNSLQKYVDYFQDGISEGDSTAIGILVAVVVIVISIVFWLSRRGASKRRGILIVGLCDSGKSLLFCQLAHRQHFDTFTSMKENVFSYMPMGKSNQPLNLVDLPGHDRVRNHFLEHYKSTARGLIFVIDSLSLQKEIKDVAEFLYTLLTDNVLSRNPPALLIACNKQDARMSKGAKLIQSQIEKEMNTLRVTQSAALQGTGDSANNNTFLGRRDRDFKFADLKPWNIQFVECSAQGKTKESEPNIADVEKWIQNIA